jgi:hypothetical protein
MEADFGGDFQSGGGFRGRILGADFIWRRISEAVSIGRRISSSRGRVFFARKGKTC